MDEKSKVYALVDEQGRILRIEGGYTMQNIDDISAWIYLDEGEGDRYNLCQTHYIEGGLLEEHGIPLYKYENGEIVRRTESEIAADLPVEEPTEPTDGSAIWDEIAKAIREGVLEIE